MSKWEDNTIQFPRFIAEAEAAGAFTPVIIDSMAESMDLNHDEVIELIERASDEWDSIKERT